MQIMNLARHLFPIKVGAIYPSERDAKVAAGKIQSPPEEHASMAIVGPSDDDEVLAKRLDKEDWGRGTPFIKAHVLGALLGAGLGALLAVMFTLAGPELTQENPFYAFSVFTYIGAFLGLIGAGFFTFRMDQDALTYAALNAKHQGYWVVIYQSESRQDAQQAQAQFAQSAEKVVKTF